jgi:hypothetical protein
MTIRLLSLLLLFFTLPCHATEVYQSTDEQGNAVFSDTPDENSETVKIQAPNVGDSIEVPPPAPEPEAKPETAPEQETPEQPAAIIVEEKDDDDDNGRRNRPKPLPKPKPKPKSGSVN